MELDTDVDDTLEPIGQQEFFDWLDFYQQTTKDYEEGIV